MRPRCQIEDACNRVRRQMDDRLSVQFHRGARVAFLAVLGVFLIAWRFA